MEKTTDLSQVTDKLYTPPWLRFEFTTPVVIGTDCIGSFKSNNHTITKYDDAKYLFTSIYNFWFD